MGTFIVIVVFAIVVWWMLARKNKKPTLLAKRDANKPSVVQKDVAISTEDIFQLEGEQKSKGIAVKSAVAPPVADEKALQIFRQHIQDVPQLSTVWSDLQRAIEQGASAGKIAKIVKVDPGLTTEVLKAANSKEFNLDTQINDVGQAIVRLGFHAVNGIVSSYCLSSVTGKWKAPFQIDRLWKHAMATSVLAGIVAKHIPGCNAGIAGTLGLLHDIGRIGLNVITQDRFRYDPVVEEGFLAYEHEHFGCHHIDTGVILAQHWNLPTNIQMGIRFHHHPGFATASEIPDEIRKEVLAVYLADMLAIHFGFSGGNKFMVEPHESFKALLKSSLHKIAHEKMVSKELWRVDAIQL